METTEAGGVNGLQRWRNGTQHDATSLFWQSVRVWRWGAQKGSLVVRLPPFSRPRCARVASVRARGSLLRGAHPAGSRSPRGVPRRALQAGGVGAQEVGAQEVGEAQAADLLHLAQGGAQLQRGRAVQPARQLAEHGVPVAEARGEHEGEAEARPVAGVELRQPLPLLRAQARQARAALLPLRLGRERAPLQLAARQVRVAAQDALLACGEAQTRGSALVTEGLTARPAPQRLREGVAVPRRG